MAGTTWARSADLQTATCRQAHPSPSSSIEVMAALRSRRDVWGNSLLAAPDGPTYEGARRYLGPLWLARAAGRTALTRLRRLLPPVRRAVGRAGRDVGRAARRRRQPDRRAARRRPLAHGLGRARRRRAVRLLSCAPGIATARGRLAADPPDALRRRGRRPLPAGVVRSPRRRRSGAHELRPADGRHPRARGRGATVRLSSSGGSASVRVPARALAHRLRHLARRHGSGRRSSSEVAYDAARGRPSRATGSGRLAEGMTVDVPERRVGDAAARAPRPEPRC